MATYSQPVLRVWEEVREYAPSPRVAALRARFDRRYAELGRRLYWEEVPARARDEAILAAYRATDGKPAILRRARALTEIAGNLPVEVQPGDMLVGHQTFNRPGFPAEVAAELRSLGYAHTTGHIVHDYAALLRWGISGLRREVARAAAHAATPEQNVNLAGFDEALDAFQVYVERHAVAAGRLAASLQGAARKEWEHRTRDLHHLTGFPPQTFTQALQMTWLAHTFLHAENPSVAISFGRIDQFLWPYLRCDVAEGNLTLEQAFDLVCAFLLKCCEGEESQNAVLGGVDSAGHAAVNPLSFLFLAAMRRMRTFQPSLVVRIHAGGDAAFLHAACELSAAGTGNPGFMNDAPVIEALIAAGVSPERARDWSVVGCYEAIPNGDCYPNTVLGRVHLVETLDVFLGSPAGQASPTFDRFLSGWLRHVEWVLHTETLPACQDAWNRFRDLAPSPFGSILMGGCIGRALPLEAGGANTSLVGINILGLGTVVDSLHVLRDVVFQRGEMSLPDLAAAVAADFPDEAVRARLRQVPGRYGTDTEATNALVRRVSSAVAEMVLAARLEADVRPYPAFFGFGGDIYDLRTASPDGRRKDELISYGVAPSTAVACSPTAALASAAQAAHGLAACGNPFSLSLPGKDVEGPEGVQRIAQLVSGYFALGGSHVHLNVTSAEELRQARADPENHANLMVRVSGYSARFVTVDPRWQDALIERAEQGF